MIELTVTAENAEGLADELRKIASNISGAIAATDAPASPAAPKTVPPENKEPEPGPRCFGKTEDGKARRTKEQMAEDDEIAELATKHKVPVNGDSPATETLESLRKIDAEAAAETEARGISDTPEDRKDPAEDLPTTADLKEAMKAYAGKFGMADAEKNLPDLMGYPKLSSVPEDGKVIAGIIAKINDALAESVMDG